ncbi:hypothetical protein [Thermochromatium tepidum]|uniref:hypothetical protein n=1 Tax=Thermochromatium tepidum TaxID=1050 RepID=UPI0031B5CE7B
MNPDDETPSALDELELSDADILEAMREIPGYLDISTDDFRAIYHLAYRRARERLLSGSGKTPGEGPR